MSVLWRGLPLPLTATLVLSCAHKLSSPQLGSCQSEGQHEALS